MNGFSRTKRNLAVPRVRDRQSTTTQFQQDPALKIGRSVEAGVRWVATFDHVRGASVASFAQSMMERAESNTAFRLRKSRIVVITANAACRMPLHISGATVRGHEAKRAELAQIAPTYWNRMPLTGQADKAILKLAGPALAVA